MGTQYPDPQDVRAEVIDWTTFAMMTGALAKQIKEDFPYVGTGWPITGFYGVPTGGCFVALELEGYFAKIPILDEPVLGCVVVDDIVDTGDTIKPFAKAGYKCYSLFFSKQFAEEYRNASLLGCSPLKTNDFVEEDPWRRKISELQTAQGWVHFPWEHTAEPQDAVVRLLQFIGENPKREGLRGTPSRVCKTLQEMTRGYSVDTQALIQGAVFSEVGKYDEMIVLSEIPFYSMCEHHMMPFFGTVHVGYIPGERAFKKEADKHEETNVHTYKRTATSTFGALSVVGISKIARLVEAHAQRLQIQERMTDDIAHDLFDGLGCLGVGVVVCGQHFCMQARGVSKPGSIMKTSSMLGAFREKREVREEFLRLCGM